MRVYLDASVIVALLTNDPLTQRAEKFLRTTKPVVVLSDFAAAEFASAIARRVRTKEMTADEARMAFSMLDAWAARTMERAEISGADVKSAEIFLRRLDLTLRTPDAINIAIAQRVDASLATFDAKMAASAHALGTEVADA